MVDTCALMCLTHLGIKPWTAQNITTPCSSNSCLTDPNLLYCGKPFESGAQFCIWWRSILFSGLGTGTAVENCLFELQNAVE